MKFPSSFNNKCIYTILSCTVAISCLLVFTSNALGVPAAPIEHTLVQPNGFQFKARQWGDEWNHGWETAEGYSIIKDLSTSQWVYLSKATKKNIIQTAYAVGEINPELFNIPSHIRPAVDITPENNKIYSQDTHLSLTEQADLTQTITPLAGTYNIPVILVNFSNTESEFTVDAFNEILFKDGNYSMKDYFDEVSYNAFTIQSGTDDPGVYGWYIAPNTDSYYGEEDENGRDHAAELVLDAIKEADSDIDFSNYDNDGDCFVDVVAIIHQGEGEESSGESDDIWSHKSTNIDYITDDETATCESITIKQYIITPEKHGDKNIHQMGVVAHEFGHAIGLPDLYDTDYTSKGIGKWALMASGSWNHVQYKGDRPAHLCAWSKYKLGWVSPALVTGTLVNETISTASKYADVYQLLNGSPEAGGEYFLVENRQLDGFDVGLPDYGLAIWHIDEAVSNNKNECNTPVGCTVHYKVSLEQADGLFNLENNNNNGDLGDLFKNSETFTPTTIPNNLTYSGVNNYLSVTNINESIDSSLDMIATISNSGPDCILQNSDFEAEANNSWIGNSSSVTTPLCNTGMCGTGARTGNGWAWFGGTISAEDSAMEQTIEIPSDRDTLSFYLWAPTTDATGYLEVYIDDEIVFSFDVTDEPANDYNNGYMQVDINIENYNDDELHTIKFKSHIDNGPPNTSFMVDDVCIYQTPKCIYDITSYSGTFPASGGKEIITVNVTGSSCGAWSTAENLNWVSISPSEGTGTDTVTLTVESNTTSTQRNGTIIIAGHAYTVTQDDGCTYSITPTNENFPSNGGESTISVDTSSNCTWSTTNTLPWATLSTNSGEGSESITITVEANIDSQRSGTIYIAEQEYTISQDAGTDPAEPCSYTISPTNDTFTSSGGNSTVKVSSSEPSCSWSTSNTLPWVSLTPINGTGENDVTLTIEANTGAQRSGTIIIAEQEYKIDQNSASCSFSISPDSGTFGSDGGISSIIIDSSDNSCSWSIINNLSWVALTPSNGSGDNSVTLTVDINTGEQRNGTISIAGQTYDINQDGSDVENKSFPWNIFLPAIIHSTVSHIDSEVYINNVPFQSQLSASCSPNYLCGFACANMLTSYVHEVSPTVDYMQDMAEYVTGERCPSILTDVTDHLDAVLNVTNTPNSYWEWATYDQIKILLTSGLPISVGVKYSEFENYKLASWDGGHRVVIVGYSESKGIWIIHDPLGKNYDEGAYREIPSVLFRNAMEKLQTDVGNSGDEFDVLIAK